MKIQTCVLIGVLLAFQSVLVGCPGSSDDNVGLSGHVIVVGSRENSLGNKDWWIKKFSTAGTEDLVNWNKVYDSGGADDEAYSVAIDSQNNVYVAGYKGTGSTPSGRNWWIKKFSNYGVEDTVGWNKTFGNITSSDTALQIAVDHEDNVYVVGIYNYNWLIKKFSGLGVEDTVNWDKSIDSTYGIDVARSIAFDSENNVYIGGSKPLAAGNGQSWWIKKFSKNGLEELPGWNKTFNAGYSGIPTSIAVNRFNQIFVLGDMSNQLDQDWMIKRFDLAGNEDVVNWNKTISGSGSDFASSLAIDGEDSVYAVGSTRNSSGTNMDWWLKKFSKDGVEDITDWNKIIDGENGLADNFGKNDQAYGVAVASTNHVYVVGYRHAGLHLDWWIKKYNKSGYELISGWNKIIDGGWERDDIAYSVAVFH